MLGEFNGLFIIKQIEKPWLKKWEEMVIFYLWRYRKTPIWVSRDNENNNDLREFIL